MNAPDGVLRWRSLVDKRKYSNSAITTDLVLAVMWQEEANGDPWAIRYEPNYQYFYNHKGRYALYDVNQSVTGNRLRAINILGQTEMSAQSHSWGLMQIIGAAARERGFMPKYLTELCDPEVNIIFGTKHLYEWGFNWGKVNLREALERWNGSSAYAEEVLAKLSVIEGLNKV